MKVFCAFGLTSFALAALCGHSYANPVLTSPAIDESLFKDGMVENREMKFDDWYAKCQQIEKIQKRVCNLLSTISGPDGNPVGSVLVATDEKGAPAMMISIVTPVVVGKPLVIKATFINKVGKKSTNVSYKKSVMAVQCDVGCKFVFPLETKLIVSLDTGNDVELAVPTPSPAGTKKTKKTDTTTFTISGRGFTDALKATSAAW